MRRVSPLILFFAVLTGAAPAAAYEIEVLNRPSHARAYREPRVIYGVPPAAGVESAYDGDDWVGEPVIRTPRPARRAAGTSGGYAPPTQVPLADLAASPAQLAAGDILIDTSRRRLYLIGEGEALRYAIGVGRDGFRWTGTHKVSAKKEWPGWTPPEEMKLRRPDLPDFMPGGPDNPLGARALYLGSTLYRIHGSNEPETIGRAVSSGCFRMTNQDVVDLYDRVKVGAKVVVR